MNSKKPIVFFATLLLCFVAIILFQGYRGEDSAPQLMTRDLNNATVPVLSSAENMPAPAEPDSKQSNQIDPKTVMKNLTQTSRYVGTPENSRSGKYIMELYQQIGLEPFRRDTYHWIYRQAIDGQPVEVFNAVGMIKGDRASSAIFVTSHFDSEQNTPGAVDNASGVTAMLMIATILQNNREYLHSDLDIIFCSFNGEEQYYLGSAAFLQEFLVGNPYDEMININLDCVGMQNGGDYMFGTSETDPSRSLNLSMKPYLERNQISTNGITNSEVNSDHKSFLRNGIQAVTLSQENLYDICHTPADNETAMDYDGIDRVSKAVAEFVIEYSL